MANSPLLIIAKQKIDGKDATGVNIRHSVEFETLKSELQKSAFAQNTAPINWSLIASQSQDILQKSSKDILIAVYLVVAWINLYQLKGWQEALEFLYELLKKFGALLQPMNKPKAHISAFDWLTTQLSTLYTDIQNTSELKTLVSIQASLNRIDTLLQSLYQHSWFSTLANTLQVRITELQKPVEIVTPSIAAAIEKPVLPNASMLPTNGPTLQEEDIAAKLFIVGSNLLEINVLDPTAYYFRRTAMWGRLRLLPAYDKNYQTMIKAPTDANRLRLKILESEADPKKAIKEIELLAGENPFWLDVQRCLWKITVCKPELLDITCIIAAHTEILYQRFPLILKLKFIDGSSFCNEATQSWLVSLRHSVNELTATVQQDLLLDLQQIIDKALLAKELIGPEKK